MSDVDGQMVSLMLLSLNTLTDFTLCSWLRRYATNRKVAGSFPDEVIGFFNLPNPSSRTMAMVSTQLLTEMSTRILSGGKGRTACKADNFTAICEPIFLKLWEPRRFTALWEYAACCRNSFNFVAFQPEDVHRCEEFSRRFS
jgi:hypothetical protein